MGALRNSVATYSSVRSTSPASRTTIPRSEHADSMAEHHGHTQPPLFAESMSLVQVTRVVVSQVFWPFVLHKVHRQIRLGRGQTMAVS